MDQEAREVTLIRHAVEALGDPGDVAYIREVTRLLVQYLEEKERDSWVTITRDGKTSSVSDITVSGTPTEGSG